MIDAMKGKNLRRDRNIAWFVVMLSIVPLTVTAPKKPIISVLLFLALLGSLVWILVIEFLLRRATVGPTQQETAFWRAVFLGAFSAINVYLCFYYRLNNWKTWSGSLFLAALCGSSAVLLWRCSPLAKYPLYIATLYLGLGALGGGIYNYMQNPALLHDPLPKQIIGWLIPGIPTVLLINCCLYARRMVNSEKLSPRDI